ncbi:unnamed protein product [Somion occarium]|uniref:Uncharacterized protein n=1 Tax=Somion occarium TaxID=3059160 RepID=A0ABP1CYA7_9APHY
MKQVNNITASSPPSTSQLGVSNAIDRPRRPINPLIHIAILTSILATVGLIPYVAVRRHALSLHRKLGDLGVANAAIKRDLKVLISESTLRQQQHSRVLSLLEKTRAELQDVKAEAHKQDAARVEAEEKTKKDVKALLAENQKIRMQIGAIGGLGEVLALIAAFMQEIEIKQGLPLSRNEDTRGYERIRKIALDLNNVWEKMTKTK